MCVVLLFDLCVGDFGGIGWCFWQCGDFYVMCFVQQFYQMFGFGLGGEVGQLQC